MASAQGKHLRAFIEVSSTLTEIACQGPITIQSGKSLSQSTLKNCSHQYISNSAFTATFNVELQNPAHATHTEIMSQHDSETPVSAAIQSTQSGGLSYTGNAYFVYETIEAGVDGGQVLNVIMGFDGDPTRGTVS